MMAKITQLPHVEVSATMQFNESELRALDALVGYGVEGFLKVFYAQMGKHYMQPHEAGLRLLFKSIGSTVPTILAAADDARMVFTGERIATRHPKAAALVVIGRDEGIENAFAKATP